MSTRKIVINNTMQPEMLESGQQLGAAGTKSASRDDVTLSEVDYGRLVETGKVSVVEVRVEAVEVAVEAAPAQPAPEGRPVGPKARGRN